MTDTPTPARPDIWQIADRLQMDLRAAQARLVELRAMLAQVDLPDPARLECRHCGLRFPGPRTLAEHDHVIHDGPVPDHWLAIEARSIDPEPALDT